MGSLHAGHLSLVKLARSRCDRVVVSLFVNPTQFGANEDLAAYPRDEAGDAALLAGVGCDLIYAPAPSEIYPLGFATTVTVSGLTEIMEGSSRPTHFAGVATVVTKLLIQVSPRIAVFGEKDYQQLQMIRRLAGDLDLPVEIVGGPIIRDRDGLALSSRNAYLTAAERQVAPRLHRRLGDVASMICTGQRIDLAEAAGVASLLADGFSDVDYLETRNPETLERLGPHRLACPARLLCAVRLGTVRLLDNLAIDAA